jgi:hypothetical protein
VPVDKWEEYARKQMDRLLRPSAPRDVRTDLEQIRSGRIGGGDTVSNPGDSAVVDRIWAGARFLLAALVDGAMLSIVWDAALWIKVATVVLGATLYGAIEFRRHIRTRHWSLLWVALGIPLILLIIVVGAAYRSETTIQAPSSASVPTAPPVSSKPPAPPPKFYSEADKGRLAEATYAISTDLTDNAGEAVNQSFELEKLFANENGQNADKYDPDPLASKLKEVRDLLSAHEETMVGINAKYEAYREELVPIWDQKTEGQSLMLFREALGDVEAHLIAFQVANRTRNTNPDALNVDHAILASMPQCIEIMREKAHDFALWVNAAQQRADNFRRSL